jgi:hypothetical protein
MHNPHILWFQMLLKNITGFLFYGKFVLLPLNYSYIVKYTKHITIKLLYVNKLISITITHQF